MDAYSPPDAPALLRHVVDVPSLLVNYIALGGAVAAGAATWLVLHKLDPVRGDYSLATFGAIYFTLYWAGNTAAIVHLGYSVPFLAFIWASSAIATTICYRLSPYHPLAGYPGPTLWKVTSLRLVIVSFGGRRHLTLDDLHRKYGKFVRIGPNALSVNSPTAGNTIYGFNYFMDKSAAYDRPGHVKAISLFFKTSREDHRVRKRIWSNAFAGTNVHEFFRPLERRTWQLTRCLEGRHAATGFVDLTKTIAEWSYDFMGDMVFGGSNDIELMRRGDTERLVHGGKDAMHNVDSFGQTPWLLDILWHLPAAKSLHRLRHKSAEMMVNRQKSKDTDMLDLASYMLKGDPVTGDPISDEDLKVDALVAIQAGSDNTASILIFALYFLMKDSSVMAKLRAELDEAFPVVPPTLDPSKLASLPYLNAVIQETLRLGTPYFTPRLVPDGGVAIDEAFVPGGTMVVLAAYTQQMSEDNFSPEPFSFLPDRWIEGALGPDTRLNKSALWSFSAGPFICVAKSFALQELRHVLTRLVLCFDWSFAPSFDRDRFYDGAVNMRTTKFKHPLLANVQRREKVSLDVE